MQTTPPNRFRGFLLEFIIPASMIGFLFALVFSPVFSAQFDWSDDHEIIRFSATEPIHPLLINRSDFTGNVSREFVMFEREIENGRFRPFYYVVRFAEIDILGRDPHVWHLYKWGIGVLTALIFYMALRLMKTPRWLGMLSVLFLVLSGVPTEIWYRLGPAETQGMLFTVMALYGVVYGAKRLRFSVVDIAVMVMLALAGWTKESFILVAPPLVMIRLLLSLWWHYPQQKLTTIAKHTLPLCFISAGIFGAQLFFIFFQVRTDYANISTNAYSPINWVNLWWSLASQQAYFIMAGIGLVLSGVGWYTKRRNFKHALYGVSIVVILLFWLVPQFILHSNGFFDSRYIYPVILGLIAINVLPLVSASYFFPRLTLLLTLPIILLWSFNNGTQTYNEALVFSARTQILHQTIQITTENASQKPNDYIVIETHPIERYEQTISTVVFLGSDGVKNPIALHLSTGDYKNHPSGLDLNARLPNYPIANDIPAEQAFLILTLYADETFRANPPIWFNDADYNRHEVMQDYLLWDDWSLNRHLSAISMVVYIRKE